MEIRGNRIFKKISSRGITGVTSLKSTGDDLREMSYLEMNILSYHHPHLLHSISVSDVVEIEFVDSNILSHVKLYKLSIIEKIPLMYQLLTAVSFLHSQGISHGNISSNNVFVSSGKVKLGGVGKASFSDNLTDDIRGYRNVCLDIISTANPQLYIDHIRDEHTRNNLTRFISSMGVDESVLKTSKELLKSTIFSEQGAIQFDPKYEYQPLLEDHRDIVKLICNIFSSTKQTDKRILYVCSDLLYRVGKMRENNVQLGVVCYIISLKLFNIDIDHNSILSSCHLINDLNFLPSIIPKVLSHVQGSLWNTKIYMNHKDDLNKGINEIILNKDPMTYMNYTDR